MSDKGHAVAQGFLFSGSWDPKGHALLVETTLTSPQTTWG